MRIHLPKALKFKAHYFFTPLNTALVLVVGFLIGYVFGIGQMFEISRLRENAIIEGFLASTQTPTPTLAPEPTQTTSQKKPSAQTARISYTGPQLWEEVNKARVQHGVNPLSQRDILCTIAAIRLSQIRQLGKLDGHDGFQGVYDKYKDDPTMPNNVAEFLISGYPTPDQAVSAWLDTLGHRKLITGGEYRWGCVYAQDGFGVAITGF